MKEDLNDHVLYVGKALRDAQSFFPRLRDEIEWQTIIWGKTKRPLPRLCSTNIPNTEIGLFVLSWVVSYFKANFDTNVKIHGVFGNYYRNGDDYLPQHRDQYDDHHVISLSFGATRSFGFKNSTYYALGDGDLIVFDPYMNKHYTHGIGKQKKVQEGRINFTIFATFDKAPYGKKSKGALSSLNEFIAEASSHF